MARGVNKVILIGNLGIDPEIRYMTGGAAVANLRIATSEAWKDKQTGETQERTEWHAVVFFNRLAEVCAEYLKKGSKIYIQGSLRTNKWKDEKGEDHYTTQIIGNEMQMLDTKNANPVDKDNQTPDDRYAKAKAGEMSGFDDSIPF